MPKYSKTNIMLKNTVFKLMIIISLIIINKSTTNAQEQTPIWEPAQLFQNDLPKLGIGLTVGVNKAGVDFGFGQQGTQFGLQLSYDIARFLTLGINGHLGKLKGGPLMIDDLTGQREVDFSNQFLQYDATLRFMPLRLFVFDDELAAVNYISYIYFGIGYGNINSKVSATNVLSQEYGSAPKYKGRDAYLVQEIGVDIPIVTIQEKTKVFIGFQYRFTKSQTDLLDGFNPTVASNEHKDVFNTYQGKIMIKF